MSPPDTIDNEDEASKNISLDQVIPEESDSKDPDSNSIPYQYTDAGLKAISENPIHIKMRDESKQRLLEYYAYADCQTTVRVLKEYGEFETGDGYSVMLNEGTIHRLPFHPLAKNRIDPLIAQGILAILDDSSNDDTQEALNANANHDSDSDISVFELSPNGGWKGMKD